MSSSNSKVWHPGPDEMRVEYGGSITNAGVQASSISDLAALTGGDSPTEAEANADRTAINAILAALRGVGIIAGS